MTISYASQVATSTGFGCFLKLLLRWRGSIYKLVWKDLLVFLGTYYCLNLTYRFLLNDQQKFVFESVVNYCNYNASLIPLSFVLGFYVSIVMTRWWNQYMTLPWPDPIAVYVSSLLRGQDEHGRVMRRTVMRYVCLSLTMALIMISPGVKKRFPTLEHLLDAGLLVENEVHVLKDMNEKFPKHAKHWMPIVWASSIVTRARKENRIRDDFSLKTIIDELNKFRCNCDVLRHYDTISIPLVYTQVVTLVVYSYFLGSIMGQQWTEKQDRDGFFNSVDYYFPIFTTLEFFFYMGWLKVAETLICPFGEDDDDFETNWLIDRNLTASYLIVDEMHQNHPQLIKDQYWDEVFPNELPYPADEENKIRDEPPIASTAKVEQTKAELDDDTTTLKIHWRRLSSLTSSLTTFGSASKRDSRIVSNESNVYSMKREEAANGKQNKLDILSTEQILSDEKDDFDLLKEERERERIERQKQKMARTLEAASNVTTDLNNQVDLINLASEIVTRTSNFSAISLRNSATSYRSLPPQNVQSEESKKKTDQNK